MYLLIYTFCEHLNPYIWQNYILPIRYKYSPSGNACWIWPFQSAFFWGGSPMKAKQTQKYNGPVSDTLLLCYILVSQVVCKCKTHKYLLPLRLCLYGLCLWMLCFTFTQIAFEHGATVLLKVCVQTQNTTELYLTAVRPDLSRNFFAQRNTN